MQLLKTNPTERRILKISIYTICYLILLPIELFFTLLLSIVKFFKDNYIANISKLPQDLRREFDMFTPDGLKHNIHYLNNPRVVRAIALADIEEQAKYVDIVTINTVNEKFFFILDLDEPISKMNATGIGNLAYIALHHFDDDMKNKAIDKLEDVRVFYQELTNSITENTYK